MAAGFWDRLSWLRSELRLVRFAIKKDRVAESGGSSTFELGHCIIGMEAHTEFVHRGDSTSMLYSTRGTQTTLE